jgi:hypothetical protein
MFGWLKSTYAKVALGAIISCVGIAGGIYLGYSMTFWSKEKVTPNRVREVNTPASWVKFGPGDAFPLEPFTDPEGKTGSFETILRDKETLVIFADWGCVPCLDLIRFNRTTMLGRLKPGVQVVLVTEKEGGSVPEEYGGLIDGVSPVMIDGAYWRANYHLVARPTIVGVDNSGIIQHVQFGYDGFIDRELVEQFFSAKS